MEHKAPYEDYPTPPWALRALLHALPELVATLRFGRVLEPSAGAGWLLRALHEHADAQRANLTAVDVQPQNADALDALAAVVLCPQPFAVGLFEAEGFDAIVANPPFSLSLEHADVFRSIARITLLFQRLSWLGTQARLRRLAAAMPSHVVVLPERTIHVASGETDLCEYAWFVWGLGGGDATELRIAPPTPESIRRADYERMWAASERAAAKVQARQRRAAKRATAASRDR